MPTSLLQPCQNDKKGLTLSINKDHHGSMDVICKCAPAVLEAYGPLVWATLFSSGSSTVYSILPWCTGKGPRNANGRYVHLEDKNNPWASDGSSPCSLIISSSTSAVCSPDSFLIWAVLLAMMLSSCCVSKASYRIQSWPRGVSTSLTLRKCPSRTHWPDFRMNVGNCGPNGHLLHSMPMKLQVICVISPAGEESVTIFLAIWQDDVDSKLNKWLHVHQADLLSGK